MAQLTKNTIFHFFAGHATTLEAKLVDEWMANPANSEQYYEWLEEWEREHPQFIANTHQALEQYLSRIDAADDGRVAQPAAVAPPRRIRWYAYAAAVALLAMAAVYLGRERVRYERFETAFGEVRSLTLPDGSHVVLNANSVLRVPRFGFGESTRDVFLEGEAEFSVVHTASHQKFLVHTPDALEVEVLGTEFIVYARARGAKVVLNEGTVRLYAAGATPAPLTIKPGDVVTVRDGVLSLKEKQPVQDHAAWKEHRFVFDRTSLEEIAHQLEDNFGVTVQIPDTLLARRRLTGTYEATSATELLEVLARVLDVEIKQEGDRVEVKAR